MPPLSKKSSGILFLLIGRTDDMILLSMMVRTPSSSKSTSTTAKEYQR